MAVKKSLVVLCAGFFCWLRQCINKLLLKRRNIPITNMEWGLAHPAEVVVMGDVQTLVQAAFDAPGGAVVFEPLGRAQFLRGQAGHQRHHFGTMVAKLTPQQGHLLHAWKVDRFGGRGQRTQDPDFQSAFVDLTSARQLRRGLPRGKNPPVGRGLNSGCSFARWTDCL